MLNPEVIELCGKRSIKVLNELIASFGDDAADTCYVKTDDLVTVKGCYIPGFSLYK